MLNQLKKESFRKVLPLAVILMLLGVGMLFLTDFGVFKLIGGPKPLDELKYDQIEGQYVSYQADLLFGCYAYTTETSSTYAGEKIVSSEYIIPVGYDDGFYMGLYVGESRTDDFDALLEDSISYLDGEIEYPGMYYDVVGTVMPMEEDSIRFFHETVGYEGEDAQYQAMFQPYYLKVDYLGKLDFATTLGLTLLGAFFLLFGLSMPIRALAGGYQSKLKKFAHSKGNETLSRLEFWYQSIPSINGVRIDDRWLMFNIGAHTHIIDTPTIAWAYQGTVTHRTNGIKTGTTYGLILRSNNSKKKVEIPMRTQDDVQEVLSYIGDHFPNIVLGYDSQRESRYLRDIAGFARTELEMIRGQYQESDPVTY